MNQLRDNLKAIGLSPNHIFQQVKEAINEDLAGGEDITSVATILDTQVSTADFICRSEGVISGLHVAAAVLEYCGITNFLAHRSGISTTTNRWVKEISGTKCKVRDTRKTTPGLRQLEKFAVRMGGGLNHRHSLSESVLIKDNHIVAAGGITSAFTLIKQKFPDKKVEIEVDTLEQLSEAILLKPDLIMLDNMSIDQCTKAVGIASGAVKLEASGGLTLENAKAYANTGVDYLAVGALTHSAQILDVGLDFRKEK